MENRVKPLEGVRNFRDFGGYTGADGRPIKPGVFFRSGHYNEATDADVEQLHSLGVSYQVDLRRPDERERQPNRWPKAPVRIKTSDKGREDQPAHVAFLQQDDVTPESVEAYMVNYYKEAPYRPHLVELYTDWFDHLQKVEGATIVNCAAGKDRTGILCALTHFALGVNEDDIFEDYLLTNTAVDIEARLPLAAEHFNDMLGKSYEADVYRPFMGVREAYLTEAIRSMGERHGSPDRYAEEVLGVTPDVRERLRQRFLAG